MTWDEARNYVAEKHGIVQDKENMIIFWTKTQDGTDVPIFLECDEFQKTEWLIIKARVGTFPPNEYKRLIDTIGDQWPNGGIDIMGEDEQVWIRYCYPIANMVTDRDGAVFGNELRVRIWSIAGDVESINARMAR